MIDGNFGINTAKGVTADYTVNHSGKNVATSKKEPIMANNQVLKTIDKIHQGIKKALVQGNAELAQELKSTLYTFAGTSDVVNKKIAAIYEECFNEGLLIKEENRYCNDIISKVDPDTGKAKFCAVEKVEYLEDGYIITRYNDNDGDGNVDEIASVYYDNADYVVGTAGQEIAESDLPLTDVSENLNNYTERDYLNNYYEELGIDLGSFTDVQFETPGWETDETGTLVKTIGNSFSVTFEDVDGDGVIGAQERENPKTVAMRLGINSLEYVDGDGDGYADSVKTIDEAGNEVEMALGYDLNDPATKEALKMVNIAKKEGGTHDDTPITDLAAQIIANSSNPTNTNPATPPNADNIILEE